MISILNLISIKKTDETSNLKSLEKKICSAAERYCIEYYNKVYGLPSSSGQREYSRWLERILYYEDKAPYGVFLPEDMFTEIRSQLGLSLLSLNAFRCLDFLVAMRRRLPKLLDKVFTSSFLDMDSFYLCCPAECLTDGGNHRKIMNAGVIMKKTRDGMLMITAD